MDEGGNNGGGMDRRREEKEKQSDARAPISQGFVIKGGRVASSVSVTLQVNKTNDTTEENLQWDKLNFVFVLSLLAGRKERKEKRTKEETLRCTSAPSQTVEAGLLAPRGDRKLS